VARRWHQICFNLKIQKSMPFEVQTQTVALSQLSSFPPFTFTGAVNNNYIYGITGFQLRYAGPSDKHVSHNVLDLGVSVTASCTVNQVILQPKFVLDDDGGNQPDPDNSFMILAVIAWVGDSNDAPYLFNTGLIPGSSPINYHIPKMPATPGDCNALLSGFQYHYSEHGTIGDDNQVCTISAAASANVQTGNITFTGAMYDNSQHYADVQGDVGFLSMAGSSGLVFESVPNQQASGSATFDMGQAMTACAIIMTGFEATYGSKAHDIYEMGAGLAQAPAYIQNQNQVSVYKPSAWMNDGTTTDVQSNTASYASFLMIGVQASAPTVGTTSCTSTATTATVSTRINPCGSTATVGCDYGTSSSYGSAAEPQLLKPQYIDNGLICNSTSGVLTFELTGLQPGTTYNFKIVASNDTGSTNGVNTTFTTAAS
jgi:hypothetical protein